MICSNCGRDIAEGAAFCGHCGKPSRETQSTGDSGIQVIIPYKNIPALIAYYLGVFSLIPCIGCPLGIAALVLGILGLKRANEHPEAKGKVHAWVGIIVGGLFGILYLVGTIIFVVEISKK